jgi:hypothetical protein
MLRGEGLIPQTVTIYLIQKKLSKSFVNLQITLAVPSVKTTNKSLFQNIKSCAVAKLTPLCEQMIGTSSYALSLLVPALILDCVRSTFAAHECFAISNYKETILYLNGKGIYSIHYNHQLLKSYFYNLYMRSCTVYNHMLSIWFLPSSSHKEITTSYLSSWV